MRPVSATKCRGRDEKCKRARRKISSNLPKNQDQTPTYDGHSSRQNYSVWLNSEIPALSMLAHMIHGPVRMISEFPNMLYGNAGDMAPSSAATTANPLSVTSGNAAPTGPRKAYSYRSGRSFVTAQSGCGANVPANRWRGEYYTNITLTGGVAMVRDEGDGFLNFNAGVGSPNSACGLGADNFSARWTRMVNFAAAGVYRFTVTVDDGARLYVDGQLIIDKWVDQGPTTYTADVPLSAGNHEVKLEYYEHLVSANAVLSWTSLSGTAGDLNMALIDPINRIGSPGKDLLSRNCNWSLPLLALPGRAGMDLGLALSLNSLIYTRAGGGDSF